MSAWIIYCYTSATSGKRYVGQTSDTAERRWRGHVKDVRKGSALPFHRAIRKYSESDFALEILETCADLNAANIAEQKWIADLKTLLPEGYNLDAGGRSGGPRHPDTRARMQESAKRFAAAETPEMRAVKSAHTRNWRASLSEDRAAELTAKQRAGYPEDRRREVALVREAALPEGTRKRLAVARWANATDADREIHKSAMRDAWAKRPTDVRRANAKRGHANRRPGESSESATSQWAKRSPEERAQIAARGWETRRAKGAA